MNFEDFRKKEEALLQEMRENKLHEADAKNRAYELCTMEHKQLKMEMHEKMQIANMKCRAKVAEIHDLHVAERNAIYKRHRELIEQWRVQNGVLPPPIYREFSKQQAA